MKRGQMQLSFGMIFSIILIIAFLSFAFYAIHKFLGISYSASISSFKNNLQSDVDKMWKGSQGSQEREYSLPSKIKKVCFIDYSSRSKGTNAELYEELEREYYENENLFLYPASSAEEFGAFEIKHIDIEKTTAENNPLCFDNKIKMTIKKDFNEVLVTIER